MNYSSERLESNARQHARAALVAAFASLIIHAILLYYLSFFDFQSVIAPVRRAIERRLPSMKVQEVRREPAPEDHTVNVNRPEYRTEAVDIARQAASRAKLPDEVAIEPPATTEDWLAGLSGNLAGPSPVPARSEWQARREILQIENPVVSDRVVGLERKRIPRIDRSLEAPDIVLAVDRSKIGDPTVTGQLTKRVGFGGAGARESVYAGERPIEPGVDEAGVRRTVQGFDERRPDISGYKPVEAFLQADIEVYTHPKEPSYRYFRMKLRRAGESLLPVMPKDIVLVQDCSASMSEQRMYFCRDGLQRCLKLLGPRDRFNVVGFRDVPYTCFPGWATNNEASLRQAGEFIAGMKAEGTTDIYATLRTLLSLPRTAGRPVIAFLVSDGRPTIGITESSDIIGEFSKLNEGAISAFSLGTIQTANSFLLELVSYCNRGGFAFIRSGRWGLADDMDSLMREFGRPVLSAVRFQFADAGKCEVYPVLSENLYLDRSLVLHGRVANDAERVVFQAVGESREAPCDMVFDIDIRRAPVSSDEGIRTEWAEQKVYHLIGRYTRKPDPAVLDEMRSTSRQYRVRIPYRKSL